MACGVAKRCIYARYIYIWNMGERWKLKGQRNRLGDAGTDSLTPSTDDADVSVDGAAAATLMSRSLGCPSDARTGKRWAGFSPAGALNTLVFTRRR